MSEIGWYAAAFGWALFLTQLGWTARSSRLRHESEQREREYCDMLDRLRDERRLLRNGLESIAKNTCCDGCREAAKVAHATLLAGSELVRQLAMAMIAEQETKP